MCFYVQYVASRCGHPINKIPFCVGICADVLETGMYPSQFDELDIAPCCAHALVDRLFIRNWCYDCWYDDPDKDWLNPLDPRIEYMLDPSAPSFDAYNWYVDEMPLNPNVRFRDIDWNPDVGKVSEANRDEEPVSPRSLLPQILTESAAFRNSIMAAVRKALPTQVDPTTNANNARPQTRSRPANLTDMFPMPPTLPNKHPKRTTAQVTLNESSSPPIPPRHTGRVLIISHTANAPAPPPPTSTSQPQKRKLLITHLSPTRPNITIAPAPVMALDATDPHLASTLQRGLRARESRTHLRSIRDSPAAPNQRAKAVAEARVRLEEMGKGESAMFKGGLRFRPAKVRRDRQGEVKAVEFEGKNVGGD